MDPISVLLVDDNPTFLGIVARFLQSHTDVTVVGTAGSSGEALAYLADLRPQVIVLDLAMPGLSGLEAIPRMRLILPAAAIIVLTLLDTEGYRRAALAAGATHLISKTTLDTELLPAIRQAAPASHPLPNYYDYAP